MLDWKVVTGEEKVLREKTRIKKNFDEWFYIHWSKQCTKERMLSPKSPLPHIYALMCLPPEQVKEKHPNYYYEKCSDCGAESDIWIETDFSFCDEYGCGMSLCPECARKLKQTIDKLEKAEPPKEGGIYHD